MTAVETPDPKTGLGLVGIGAAACIACCAAPIAGFIAATGIASVLGAVLFGVVGLVAVLLAGTALIRRRRRQRRCTPSAGPVDVDTPRLKTPT